MIIITYLFVFILFGAYYLIKGLIPTDKSLQNIFIGGTLFLWMIFTYMAFALPPILTALIVIYSVTSIVDYFLIILRKDPIVQKTMVFGTIHFNYSNFKIHYAIFTLPIKIVCNAIMHFKNGPKLAIFSDEDSLEVKLKIKKDDLLINIKL